ncbi:uncharacterized protein LOC143627680 [Bidens hawaiensis]|uniref:uncharacterized protein LOC143627680 n=1 Tax=Bidens hawaiensis TaxID=980011 RepID=UPI00404AC40B
MVKKHYVLNGTVSTEPVNNTAAGRKVLDKHDDDSTKVACIMIAIMSSELVKGLEDLGAHEMLESWSRGEYSPGSLYDQYDFGQFRKADTTVVLADLTLKLPRGLVTDVIVMTEYLYYPVDFLVLDYVTVDPKRQPNVILGRPFLATANALINCRTEVVDMGFGNKNLRLNVFSNVSNSLVSDECFAAEVINGLNPHESEEDATEECAICCYALLLQEEEEADELYAASIGKPPWSQQVERLPDTINSKLRPSLESPSAVELKELSRHLKYVFLGE